MTGQQHIVGALFIDLGEGREIKKGDRAGQIRWTRPPRARFECLLCGTREAPVIGPKDTIPTAVAAFVTTIRAQHHQTHHTNQQGAQAA